MTPSIAELTASFLNRSTAEPDFGAEVEAYDVATAFRTEPRQAWAETLVVFQDLGQTPPPRMLPEFTAAVRAATPMNYVPMAFGTFPQVVSDLGALINGKALRNSISLPILDVSDSCPAAINQRAAQLFLDGDTDAAKILWQTLPDSGVRAFNLGMAALSHGDTKTAISQLKLSDAKIPDTSGWHALATLYRTLAESKA
jgi:hypothetical protein